MSKGSKRNKDSDFEGGDNSDDDFEKDFRNKKTKKTRADSGSGEKKLRERRSTRVDPLESEIKKAIELSLKENSTDYLKEKIPEEHPRTNEEEVFEKEIKKDIVAEPEQSEIEERIEICEQDDQEAVQKPKKTSSKKKSKKFESEEEDYEAENSDDDFKISKPKKRTPPKKKQTPNSKKKDKKLQENSIVFNEQDLNKEKINVDEEKPNEKVVVSLEFDELKEESKIVVPKLSSSRKSLGAIETNKSERKNLNTSLNVDPSPLGRIEIKASQPQYRVGLSRNSKVKPLHPNINRRVEMGNIMNKEWTQHVDDYSSSEETCEANSSLLGKKNKNLNNDYTPANDRVIHAEFDPRSPSNGIVRTPICYMNENNGDSNTKKSTLGIIDPRSPTNDYKRTPIHLNTVTMVNKTDPNEDNFNESHTSLDNSSLVMAESSILLQQVPENTNYNLNDSPGQYGLKIASSNMPRHILHRKQVEKLNKKKLIDLHDKEN
ncbi:hypothetical protein BpHYR1_033977 [Brachionus plicatilis]|uniref:RAD51 interacting motif domain-containing protein n=1 Tax=Brachionus plicatilis TaxID=10195 RepID=A0A3M7R3Y8_BRAPC|nr:hypothetical protein BpHYR1_033977 [Brachionus plicatilis]